MIDGEEILARIVDSALDAIVTIDESYRIILFNDAAEKMFACPVAEALGSLLDRFIPERFHTAHRIHVGEFAASSVTSRPMGRTHQVLGRRGNGEEFPLEASISLVEVQGQKLFTATLRDTTARCQTEAALRASEAFNAAILDSLSAHVAVLDGDGKILAVNQAWLRFAAENGGEMSLADPIGADYRAVCLATAEGLAAWAGIATVLAGHRDYFELEYPCHSANQKRWFRMRVDPLRSERGGVVVAHEDISSSRNLADTLHTERQRLANIIAGTDVGTWEWNVETGAVLFNERWAGIIGYTLAEIAPLSIATWLRFAHPDDLEKSNALLRRHFAGELPAYDCECRMRHRDGYWVWVRDRGKVMEWSADGRPLHMFGTHLDITESKEAEARLRELNESHEARVAERTRQLAITTQIARSASRAKSAFLANMSHEIRTPMTAILGLADLIKLDSPSPRQAERLDKLQGAAQHLLSLIDDVLDFSKIEAGKLVLEQVPCDVAGIVSSVVEMSTDRARQQGLTLSSDCESLPDPLLGDPTRLRQALLNYVSNAIRFTPQGSIRISVRRQEEQKDHLMLRFEVRDTGIGIAPSSLGRLFRHFEQADDSMTRVHGGTGLGLAIVKQIAEKMGGGVGVDSTEGIGSTFWFTACLRRAPERAGGGTSASVDTAAQQAPAEGRILIVDDEPINREVIVSILGSRDLRADCAANGATAVELAGKGVYDLILMDLQMPIMDGFEATRRIRQQPKHAQVPILGLTGNVVKEVQDRCRAVGMNDFIAKPFRMAALLEVVTRWLRPSPGE
ncbi:MULTISPECIES: PAS domain S-box protein [Candidatus Accumulibacter]|uniref:Virulence sensor protein BvgS n=1 Tax=Candidatus Accumulibacter cognatus TaxID=2954383 RepID=A0A080M4S6_9PROT|nr:MULTISPECIES: PAS domain S-box protein [Candidatus Accumulibacter]KFB75495.1 MAG: Autoinducer 2 sensor kinase/phosphatase LuxQ [Candidatus Accumulibacter cognatus]MCM8623519.1 PAS domain S-box protein [Accumulibacter sp.]